MAKENKQRINLNDLEKGHVFKVDDSYFESLAGKIQERVTSKQISPWYDSWKIKMAILAPAMMMIFAVGYVLFQADNIDTTNIEAMLEEVDTNDLIAYLDNSEITTDELLEIVGAENIEFEDFENEDIIDFSDQDLSEIDIEDLYDEFDL